MFDYDELASRIDAVQAEQLELQQLAPTVLDYLWRNRRMPWAVIGRLMNTSAPALHHVHSGKRRASLKMLKKLLVVARQLEEQDARTK
jgi:hypothetical protein